MQTEEQYAATLIAAELVYFENRKDGLTAKASRIRGWDQWLVEHDMSYNHGDGEDVAEMSDCRVCLDAFTRHRVPTSYLCHRSCHRHWS
jgi:hypothetical protein